MGAGGGFWDWEQEAERRDRAAAAGDARAAAADRAEAAEDRDRSSRDRGAAAQDRVRAAADREQAAIERAQGHHDRGADPVIHRSHWLIEGVQGAAQQASQASAALVRRFIQAKQRELAAHQATALVYEQLAELEEERFGQLARAAEARVQAAHARELYELAEGELAPYQARITAIRIKRAAHQSTGNGRPVG